MGQILTYLFVTIYSVTIIGILLVVITENRNPLKTLPWIILLTFAPVVGLVIYFFFGQNLSKQHIISRRTRRRMTMELKERHTGAGQIPERYRPLSHMLSATSMATPLYGSRLTPYTDGESKLEALLAEMAKARHHIHLQYYILAEDETTRRVTDLLRAKVREGVKVRILYDDVGCAAVKNRFFDSLRRDGIEVYSFLRVAFPLFTSKVNYRNHRKIVVIDGRVGFVGGMNIADRYVKGTEWGTWRDTHFRMEGNATLGLQASFLSDWSATTKSVVTGDDYFPAQPELTGNILQIVPSGPFGKWRTLLQAVSYAVTRAEKRVWVQTPYYLPSEVLNNAFQEAALAGIDITLMLPRRSDSRVIDLASHSFLDDMVKAGVKIALYEPGFLHSKLLVIDDELTIIGSANMDFRSFEHNFEISGFVYDREFNRRMSDIFLDDMSRCHLLTPAEWFSRSRGRRIAESFMRIFSPLM